MADPIDTGGPRKPGTLKAHQTWDDRQNGPIGHDPRTMTVAELEELGHCKRPLLSVIRAKCLDCCVGSPSEIRRCGMVDCPNWPFRMATNPFHHKRLTAEQRAIKARQLRDAVSISAKSGEPTDFNHEAADDLSKS